MKMGLVFAYISLLYSMIPFARPLQRLLEKSMGFWFEFGIILIYLCCLVGSVLFLRFFQKEKRAWPYGLMIVIWGILACFLNILEIAVEKIHFLEYAILGMLLSSIISRRSNTTFFKVFAVGTLIGLGDELIQGLCPSRFFDWRDVAMNAIGVGIGLLYMALIKNSHANPEQETGNR